MSLWLVSLSGAFTLEMDFLHIMLFGLEAPLMEGERFAMTLIFEKAGEIEVEVAIEGIAEMDGGHQGHGMNQDAGS